MLRQVEKVARHCAIVGGFEHALWQAMNAAVVAFMQAESPWQRAPAVVHAF